MAYSYPTGGLTNAAAVFSNAVLRGAEVASGNISRSASEVAQGTRDTAKTIVSTILAERERKQRAAIAREQMALERSLQLSKQKAEDARFALNMENERLNREQRAAEAAEGLKAAMTRHEESLELTKRGQNITKEAADADRELKEKQHKDEYKIRDREQTLAETAEGKKPSAVRPNVGESGPAAAAAARQYEEGVYTYSGKNYTVDKDGGVTVTDSETTPNAEAASMSPENRQRFVDAFVENAPSVILTTGDRVPNPRYTLPGSAAYFNSAKDRSRAADAMKYARTKSKGATTVGLSMARDEIADKVVGRPIEDGVETENDVRYATAWLRNEATFTGYQRDPDTGEVKAVPMKNDVFQPFGYPKTQDEQMKQKLSEFSKASPHEKASMARDMAKEAFRNASFIKESQEKTANVGEAFYEFTRPKSLEKVGTDDLQLMEVPWGMGPNGSVIKATFPIREDLDEGKIQSFINNLLNGPPEGESSKDEDEERLDPNTMASLVLTSEVSYAAREAEAKGLGALFSPVSTQPPPPKTWGYYLKPVVG